MITEFTLDLYLNHLESIFLGRDIKKIKKVWNKTVDNMKILEYSSNLINDSFKSNVIVEKILEEKRLYNTEVYNKIINIIYSNKILQRKKTLINCSNSFLTTTLYNENLILNDKQKKLLVFEAKNSLYADKTFNIDLKNFESIHGSGLNDIRYRILCNVSFPVDEKINLIKTFYLDDEMKLAILKELEWNIALELNMYNCSDNYDEIYALDINNLSENIVSKINLCREIKNILPPTIIKRYKNNE